MATDEDPTDRYRRAGMTENEIRAVTDLAAEVESADPFARSVAVPLIACITVLRLVNRLAAPREGA